ncbi:MAG: response regulator, partial [Nitrospinaceae bacterium]
MLNKKDLLRSKILIVDDELVNGKMLETVLRREGFVNVQFTPSPLESLEIYRKTRPDLVLLDLRMPEMDGFEVLQEFWKMETEFYPLVIVLTAESDHVIRLKALKAGAKDFLSKPLDLPEVLYRCQNLLEMRLLHNQLYDQKTRMEQMVQDRTVELRQANKQLKSEIAERAEIEKRLQKQNVLLELIAKNSPLNECLNRIQEFIEVYAESPA